jgi:hypothetical protein
MKGEIPPLPLHAFMEHRGTTLPFASSHFLFPPYTYMSHLFLFNNCKVIKLQVQIMQHFIIQLASLFCYFTLHQGQYSTQHFILKHPFLEGRKHKCYIYIKQEVKLEFGKF